MKTADGGSVPPWLPIAALGLIAAAYLAQLPTPLRLHNDTVVLLSLGESAAHGGGFLYHGQVSQYPPVYPAILALLIHVGVFHVWTAVALNFLFLALGLWAARQLFPQRWSIVFLTLLSFVTIKHYSIPLTDLVFFGVAMLCLVAMQRERLWEATALVMLAIATRRNGVALAPPLLWLLYRRRPILIVPALAAVALTIRMTSTLTDFHKTVAGHTLLDSARQILGFRAMEFGEIAANLPAIAIPAAAAVLPWLGTLLMALIAAGIWTRRKLFGPVGLFFLGYAAILFVWPYYDPRFWLPVLPLIFGYAGRVFPRKLGAAYGILFGLIGAMVLAASIRITYSGADFPNAYGNAQFRPTYCAFYQTCSADPKEIDAGGLHLVRTYQ